MLKKYLNAFLPHLNLLTKILLIIAILIIAAGGGLLLRLQQGPLDLDFARIKLEEALSDPAKGYRVDIDNAYLTWPAVTDSILIELNGVEITDDDMKALSVDRVRLGLSGLHLLIGKILPSILILDGPTFQLVHEDGSLNFFWQKKSEPPSETKEQKPTPPRELRKTVKEFLEQITNPRNSNINALSALKRFEITNAVITGQNVEDDISGYLAVMNLSLHKQSLGLQGKLTVLLPGEEGDTASFQSNLVYRRKQKDLTFTADVSDINPSRFAPYFPDQPLLQGQDLLLGGSVKAAFDEDLQLQQAVMNLWVPEGNLNLPELYDNPLHFKDAVFDAQLNRPANTLAIHNFSAVVGGIPLKAKAIGTLDKGNISAPVEIAIEEVAVDNISAIVPKSHLESSAGEWLTKRLSKGRLLDVMLTTDFVVSRDPETRERNAVMTNVRLSFKGDGVTIKYSDTLMPVTETICEGLYENDTLVIKGETGKIGDVTGKNIVVTMTDLSVEGGGKADISLDASGPFATALKYASDEPIALGSDLGFDPKNVKGNIDFHLQLNFPTVKDLPKEEVTVKIDGKLTDLLIPGIVQGLPLTGGPYDLGYADGAITLKGNGKLAERNIDVDWLQYFDPAGHDFESQIKAKITADEGLRKAFGIGLEDYISGPIPIDIVYTDKGETATIDVTGDLLPTVLHIDPFDYRKPPEVKGSLSLKAYMKGDALAEVDKLNIQTQDFTLTDGRIIFKKLKDGSTDISRGNFPQVALGKTTVGVDFEVTADNVLKAAANGAVVDISPFINTDKKPEKWNKPKDPTGQPMNISVTANRMLADKGEIIGPAKLYLETNNQGDVTRIEMDSKIGDGDMYLRFKPEAETGRRTFRLESSDAGYTLKAFGLYDKISGGSLVIYGQPNQGDLRGNLFGTAKIENFRVKNAPALAKLLSVMSLSGVQNLLSNEGLSFAKLESDFEWRFRNEGNLLVAKDGRTSGSSLGLTFEGVVNQGTRMMDISGTIIPISEVNNVISNIPLIGDILTGGDALIAATYTMRGPTADPRVMVNPLSVLTPGFLRRIFFESDVDAKVKREEGKK